MSFTRVSYIATLDTSSISQLVPKFFQDTECGKDAMFVYRSSAYCQQFACRDAFFRKMTNKNRAPRTVQS